MDEVSSESEVDWRVGALFQKDNLFKRLLESGVVEREGGTDDAGVDRLEFIVSNAGPGGSIRVLFVSVEDLEGSMVTTAGAVVGCVGVNFTWTDCPAGFGLTRLISLTPAFGVDTSSGGVAYHGWRGGLGAAALIIDFNASVACVSDPNGIAATPLIQCTA